MDSVETIVGGAVNSLVAAFFGFLSALAVFRSKFAVMDAQRVADLAAIEAQRVHDNELRARDVASMRDTLERVERINRATLELVSNIAQKAGMAGRAVGVDALAELLLHGDNPDAKKD